MVDPKGDKLFVNLSASQTRRRLKGFGHGVRKIHSAGRNQSVIIHTATGRHLHELQAQFADVGFSAAEFDLSEPIANLRNMGPASSQWLREIGIGTIAELQRIGPSLAFRLVRQRQPRPSLNFLWAMAAGLQGKDWRELTDAEKQKLMVEIDDD